MRSFFVIMEVIVGPRHESVYEGGQGNQTPYNFHSREIGDRGYLSRAGGWSSFLKGNGGGGSPQ